LNGAEPAKPLPAWSLGAFASGEFQRLFDAWFAANMGLRGTLVRTDNQLNFSLLGESSSSYASRIVVGAENTLFEYFYIQAYRGENRQPSGRLASLAKRLRRAQDVLARQGKLMLVLISPTKPYVYPERLGPWAPPPGSRPTTDYDVLVPMLRAEGVRVLDAAALLREWRPRSRYPLFAKGGTHWSQYGACLVAAEIARRVGEEIGRALFAVDCGDVEVRRKPRYFDTDLADLLNVWTKRAVFEPLAYPNVRPERAAEHARRPRAVFIGSSFVWPIADYLSKAEVFDELSFLYYYNSKFAFAGAKNRQVSWQRLRWKEELAPYDVVLLEESQAALASIGHGFLDDVSR
jgi:hypothetical protein